MPDHKGVKLHGWTEKSFGMFFLMSVISFSTTIMKMDQLKKIVSDFTKAGSVV